MEELTHYQIEDLAHSKYPLRFLYRNTVSGVEFAAMDVKSKRITEIFVSEETLKKMGVIEACFYFFNRALKTLNEDAEIS